VRNTSLYSPFLNGDRRPSGTVELETGLHNFGRIATDAAHSLLRFPVLPGVAAECSRQPNLSGYSDCA
jgi:hypothetical protein